MTECLKERDAQLEFNKLKQAATLGQDRAYIEQERRDLEDAIYKDQQEAQKRTTAAKTNTKFLKAQSVNIIFIKICLIH